MVVVVAIALTLASNAYACSCAQPAYPVSEAFERAALVVLAQSDKSWFRQQHGDVKLEILESWKGSTPVEVVTYSYTEGPGMCAQNVDRETKYLLFLYPTKPQSRKTNYFATWCDFSNSEIKTELPQSLRDELDALAAAHALSVPTAPAKEESKGAWVWFLGLFQ